MQDYIANVLKTESPVTPELIARMSNPENIRLLHAAIGLATEAGEILDQLKKHVFYGKPLDKTNLKEELGDGMFYMGIMMDVLGTDFPTEQKRNIDKLRARYGEKFSEQAAINRDLNKERSILETDVSQGSVV
jgi:NTP pyrophosphatase (non-canonical NTP hydrolase)